MYDNVLTAIDIGTDSIKILIAEKRDDFLHFEVLGFVKVPCSGVVKGVVRDVEEVTKSIKNGLEKLKEIYSDEISSVYLNIGKNQISTTHSDGTIMVSMANKKILKKDIDRVLEESVPFSIKNEKEILGIFAKEYILDDKEVSDPLNLKGKKLRAKTIILTTNISDLEKLKRAVLQTGLKINKIVPSFLADASIALTENQKENGVVLVNLGANNVEISIFKNNKLLNFSTLPFGSANITNDIAIKLNCHLKTADRIKNEIEILLEAEKADKGKTELTQGENAWEENLIFSPKDLYNNVILPRIQEIFEQMGLEVNKTIKKELLPSGVIIVGGGAKLFDIINIAKKKLYLNVEIGLPKSFSLINKDSGATTICGLILTKHKDKSFETVKTIKIIEENVKKTVKGIVDRIKNLKQ